MPSEGEVGDLLCKLAHDLNNKLAVILGCCDLLRDAAEEGSECAKRLDIIQTTAQAMARDIRQGACRLTDSGTAKIGPMDEKAASERVSEPRAGNPLAEPPSGG
jgi:signal transduction histidine kinase